MCVCTCVCGLCVRAYTCVYYEDRVCMWGFGDSRCMDGLCAFMYIGCICMYTGCVYGLYMCVGCVCLGCVKTMNF